MKLSDVLKQFQDDPEKLDLLAQAITQATGLQQNHDELSQKVDDLQESNRKLLKMVNIPSEPKPNEEPEKPLEPSYTLDSGVECLINMVKEN